MCVWGRWGKIASIGAGAPLCASPTAPPEHLQELHTHKQTGRRANTHSTWQWRRAAPHTGVHPAAAERDGPRAQQAAQPPFLPCRSYARLALGIPWCIFGCATTSEPDRHTGVQAGELLFEYAQVATVVEQHSCGSSSSSWSASWFWGGEPLFERRSCLEAESVSAWCIGAWQRPRQPGAHVLFTAGRRACALCVLAEACVRVCVCREQGTAGGGTVIVENFPLCTCALQAWWKRVQGRKRERQSGGQGLVGCVVGGGEGISKLECGFEVFMPVCNGPRPIYFCVWSRGV